MINTLLNLDNLLSKGYKNILFLLYLLVIFLTNYFLLSNENYMRGVMENIKSNIENRQVVEMTERGMEAMLQNPAMIVSFSLKPVFQNFYSLLILIFLSWLIISFYTDKWISILEIYYCMSTALIFLLFGAIINFGVMYLTYSPVSWFEFGAYFDYFSLEPIVKKLSKGYNLFTLLTIAIFSKYASAIYQEKFIAIFSLVNLSWVLILVVSYFLNIGIGLN